MKHSSISFLTDGYYVGNEKRYSLCTPDQVEKVFNSCGISGQNPFSHVFMERPRYGEYVYRAPKYLFSKDTGTVLIADFELFPSNRHWYLALTSASIGKRGATRGRLSSAYCAEHYPHQKNMLELLDLMEKYHLFYISSDMDTMSPLHYVENAWYWYGRTQYQTRDNETLASHLGVSLEEAEAIPDGLDKEDFASYLKRFEGQWKTDFHRIIELWQTLPLYTDLD